MAKLEDKFALGLDDGAFLSPPPFEFEFEQSSNARACSTRRRGGAALCGVAGGVRGGPLRVAERERPPHRAVLAIENGPR